MTVDRADPAPPRAQPLQGIGVCPGRAAGPVAVMGPRPRLPVEHPEVADVEAEALAAVEALSVTAADLERRAAASTVPGAAEVLEALRRFDNGTPVDAIMTPPEVEGRVFYNDAITGFNFVRNRLPIAAVAEQVMRYGAFERAPAVAAYKKAVAMAPLSEVGKESHRYTIQPYTRATQETKSTTVTSEP